MPWYRTEDGQGIYHALIRSRAGAPAACRAPRLPGDNPADGAECGRMGGKLCDAPIGKLTCDMPLCEKHATHVEGKNLDYCPRHAHLAPPRERSAAAAAPSLQPVVDELRRRMKETDRS